ncbi:MAG: GGDEF and EAL domain-containing protein [Deltaproteobacteria bacterium]|nr:GGDEF and EAL domain-containing protein [Deltaproteobacteria bacterium]
MKGIKSFIFTVALVVVPIVSAGIYFFTSYLYEKSVVEYAMETSHAISDQTVNSMYQVMKRGWTRKEVEEFLSATGRAFSKTNYSVDIYRGEIVEKLYGKIEQKEMDRHVKEAFNTGKEINLNSENLVRFIYPLKASGECFVCHKTMGGEVLGVLDLRQDISAVIHEVKNRRLLLFILVMPFPILGALLAANFIIRRINVPLEGLHQKAGSIVKIKAPDSIGLETIDFGFNESGKIFSQTKRLTDKIKEVSVDRDILEFEIKLLEKFIVISDVISDWKEHIKTILKELNNIIEVYSICSVFHEGGERYTVEVFWTGNPSAVTSDAIKNIIRNKIKDNPCFNGVESGSINIIENIADPSLRLEEVSEDIMRLQTKHIFLEGPRIGGIMGLLIQINSSKDPAGLLVIDSILTTLLNVAGSVKAIYRHTEELEYYATRDPLTHLYNQRVFWELLHYEAGRAERYNHKFSLLVIDIDNFKTLNDVHGHSFGDKFLQEYAGVLRKAMRDEDIFARYGGDEFVAILPEADREQAYLVAERVREYTSGFSMLAPDGKLVHVTVSAGAAVFPDNAEDIKDLFPIADNMMYRAKAQRGNRVELPTDEDIADTFKKIGEKSIIIMNAVEKNNIVPNFQPVMNIFTGRIEANEVLMRIPLQDETLMDAREFIEMAENMGVINKLDYMLMEKTFGIVKKTNYQGSVFINLSPKILIASEFMPTVNRLTRDYGIDAERIVFEITERDTIKNISHVEKFVMELKLQGFKFAMDDFGSGFSSFQYIKRFSIDFVKLDGEFIRGMNKNSMDRAIVLSMVALAKELGIKTIAEFVEDEEILRTIKETGIDYGQGYYIGRPSSDITC